MDGRRRVNGMFGTAQFLTIKFQVSSLKSNINVHDFQLRDHFINVNNLYSLQCDCRNHKHNKRRCTISDEKQCRRCGKSTKLLLKYESMLFHGRELLNNNSDDLYTCCVHKHTSPCGRCCNCNIVNKRGEPISKCVVTTTHFECICMTDMVCSQHQDRFANLQTRPSDMIHEHIYNTKMSAFYFCLDHEHYHLTQPSIPCHIQTFLCCPKAISVREYRSSFIVTINNITRNGEPVSTKPNIVTKMRRKRNSRPTKALLNNRIGTKTPNTQEYIIFDPSIWRDQSFNHFISFIRAVITIPASAKMRYSRFESSNFAISNIKKYKSGKESVSRTIVTGFETKGIYQTSTISCMLPHYKVLIPRILWDLLKDQHYDLSLVCVKRDPSIKPTCMFVCMAEPNPNPEIDTIVIPDALAIGLNQDQDGDKNAIYVLPTRYEDYDRCSSYLYALAKMELERAYKQSITLIAQPRYFISETNLLHIRRYKDEFMDLEFAKRTIERGSR
nr:lef-9 [Apis mellifera nudivirus]